MGCVHCDQCHNGTLWAVKTVFSFIRSENILFIFSLSKINVLTDVSKICPLRPQENKK